MPDDLEPAADAPAGNPQVLQAPEDAQPNPAPAAAPEPVSSPAAAPDASAGAAPAPAAPQLSQHWEQLREWGVDPGAFQNDEQAVQWVMSSLAQTSEMQGLAQLGRQYLANREMIEQALREQAQPSVATAGPAPAPQAAPQSPAASAWKWEPPEYDPSWEQVCKLDPATGMYVPVDQRINPAIADKLNQYKQFEAKWIGEFRRNPSEFMTRALGDRLSEVEERAFKRAVQYVSEMAQVGQATQTIQQVVQENAPWMYQVDAHGNELRDAHGQRLLTPAGIEYARAVQELEASGVRDPRKIDQIAKWRVAPLLATQQPDGTPQDPHQARRAQYTRTPNRDPKGRFVGDALRAPNSNGTLVAQSQHDVPQNRELSFLELAKQDMRQKGMRTDDA